MAGCNFPTTLSEKVSSYGRATGIFELVGEAYGAFSSVHGIMAGEAISKIRETSWWEDFLDFLPLKQVRWREIMMK
ncbi:hypothetical protein GCG54_00013418 [Colletotrichum gloeosporioides]|uniref:Uncharacterized protein n=1 Tax=Colletotrichum gloeosporioides TaxID=474922 RepID=A0A8H4CG21_COLGL|nr:uncharacterized protein GCG54_00013418 [Colletotrichum gloeosporioides]KAF3803308.1 hypothetical protein GCG54_00013418 [Colletotrichum gloeosporioides]